MTARARVALWLWLAFAAVAWSVAFDAQVRLAAFGFAHTQLENWHRGQPVVSIEDGFRPEVRAAAARAATLAAIILLTGITGVAWSSRTPRHRS